MKKTGDGGTPSTQTIGGPLSSASPEEDECDLDNTLGAMAPVMETSTWRWPAATAVVTRSQQRALQAPGRELVPATGSERLRVLQGQGP